MGEGVVEVVAPAVGYGTAHDNSSGVISCLAGIDESVEARILHGEESVAARAGYAGAIGQPYAVHVVQGVQIAAGVVTVDIIEEVSAGAAGDVLVPGAGEHVLKERLRGNQARVGLHLSGSQTGVIQLRELSGCLHPGLAGLGIGEFRHGLGEILIEDSAMAEAPGVSHFQSHAAR